MLLSVFQGPVSPTAKTRIFLLPFLARLPRDYWVGLRNFPNNSPLALIPSAKSPRNVPGKSDAAS